MCPDRALSLPVSLPTLYHGTQKGRATKILQGGFRRVSRPSGTGHAVNFSTSIGCCWEYGDPFNGGAMLKVALKPETVVHQVPVPNMGGWNADPVFARTGADAVVLAHHLWLVWKPSVIASVEVMTKGAALKALFEHIVAEGPNVGYNADAGDYARIVWGEAPAQAEGWILDHMKTCARRVAAVTDLRGFWAARGIKPYPYLA